MKHNIKTFMEELINEEKNAVIYLVNGIKLQGKIKYFDSENNCIMLAGNINGESQLVFLHAVSTIGSTAAS